MAEKLPSDRDEEFSLDTSFAPLESDDPPAMFGDDVPHAESTEILPSASAMIASITSTEMEAVKATESTEDEEGATRAALSRPQRATQYRTERRARLSTALPALLMLGMGIGLFFDGLTPELDEIPRALLLPIAVVGLGLSLLWRFFLNGRRERGLFILSLMILGSAGVVVLVQDGQISTTQAMSGLIMLLGLAVIAGLIFGRGREPSNLLIGVICILVGALSLLILEGALSAELQTSLVRLTPAILIVGALLWLPRVLRPPEA